MLFLGLQNYTTNSSRTQKGLCIGLTLKLCNRYYYNIIRQKAAEYNSHLVFFLFKINPDSSLNTKKRVDQFIYWMFIVYRQPRDFTQLCVLLENYSACSRNCFLVINSDLYIYIYIRTIYNDVQTPNN